jgi:hypothetical protein
MMPFQFYRTRYIASKGREILKGELQRMWKEQIVMSFKALSQNLLRVSEENHKTNRLYIRSLGRT